MASTRIDNEDSPNLRIVYEELKLLRESVTFCSNKVSDFEGSINKHSDYVKLTNQLRTENEQLKSELSKLSAKINNIEQTNRLRNVEISGVTEQTKENLVKIVQTNGNAIDFKIDESTIESITRVPTNNSDKRPKNIVLTLNTRRQRDDIIASAKLKIRNSSSKPLILDGMSTPFYLNEHLTMSIK
ncbi:uncharacterized protein LOC115885307 [Sitophilus oryzae]|uniref:Uncharacterized protein LOC115885307 n=1 Tax=Sitophilus oryzae TaxID=7048 RepID=A0A6J2YAT0_SITOR|nr:uncharacterized protein LOC115885307 [Sitophilus oryzae]